MEQSPAAGTYTTSCAGRTWNIGEAISPLACNGTFCRTSRRSPSFTGHGGYMYTTHPIPVDAAGSFNFTFDLGAGIELYDFRTSSIRAEYRYHHISNHETAYQNPGIDNGLLSSHLHLWTLSTSGIPVDRKHTVSGFFIKKKSPFFALKRTALIPVL